MSPATLQLSRTLALGLAMLVSVPVAGGAQAGDPLPRATVARVPPPLRSDVVTRDAAAEPAIVARAMPASFVVVAVPRPSRLASAVPLRFRIIDTGVGSIVGGREGTVTGDSLLVTVGLPRSARAGRSTVAHVLLRAAGHLDAEIPLELEIGIVRRIVLSLPREQQGVEPGGRVEVGWRVQNDGNALDSVTLRVELPTGWRRGRGEQVLALAAGASASGTLRVHVPPSESPGGRRVGVVAISDGIERGRAQASIEIADPRLSGRRAGARLAAGMATVVDGDGLATAVAAIDLAGQLTDSVRVQGRVVSDPTPDAAALRGLSRVGYGGTPWYLVLDAPEWRMDLGAVHVRFTPLTGQSATGNGGAFALTRGSWSGEILAAGPTPGLQDGSADYIGARLARSFDSVRVGATITHLIERSEIGRSLDAVGIDVAGPLAFGSTVAGQLAWRDHRTGRGIGWLAEIARRNDDGDHLQLRATGAPGGSGAFARAARELSAAGSRRLSRRTALGGVVWNAIDESALGQHVSMSGWSIAPRFLVSDHTALALEIAGNGYDSRTGIAGFGSGEQRAAVVLDTRWRSVSVSTRLQHGIVDRSVELASGTAHRTSAGRTAWYGTLSSNGPWGAADVTARLERSDAEAGYEPRRNEAQLRAQSPALPLGRIDVLVRGEVHHFGWFGDRPSLAVVRAAADLQLPWNVRITLDAERNPLFSSLGGGSDWSTALRITRSVTLPRLLVEHAAEGLVFQDLDANGRRDAGEPGLQAAVLRYGQSHAVTDARGRYEFQTRQGGAPQLDVRSIPLGWIVTGTTTRDEGRRTDIGVAPTSAVRVSLSADTSAQPELVARIAWPLVRVTVRSATGREWAAPVDAAGNAFFDAIPAGRYTIVLDLERLAEPMTIVQGDPTFVIGIDRGAIERALVLRARPIRVRRIEPPGGDR